MKRPIALSLSPNINSSDVFLAFSHLINPFSYVRGDKVKLLEAWFRNYFRVSHAISFNSGRTALTVVLKSLEIGKGDEVLLQAFTCVAVPNSVIVVDAKPVYVDIDKNLTIDVNDLEEKITKKTKAIIVQHTFGIPSHMNDILQVAKKNNLKVIEDCAHTIGGMYQNKKLGTFGDAAIYSFGRDKVISSVFGGMAITNNTDLGKKIRSLQKNLPNPSFVWIMQQLFHPVAFFLILPLYNFFSLGKLLLVIFQKIKFLSFPVFGNEKIGKPDPRFLQKMPNALSSLALFQLKRITEFNKKREEFGKLYLKELKNVRFEFPYTNDIAFLRFPVLVEKQDNMLSEFKKNNIFLGNWYASVIDPKGVDFKKIYYEKGSCPSAEHISKKIINLPTYPMLKPSEIRKIIQLLKQYGKDS